MILVYSQTEQCWTLFSLSLCLMPAFAWSCLLNYFWSQFTLYLFQSGACRLGGMSINIVMPGNSLKIYFGNKSLDWILLRFESDLQHKLIYFRQGSLTVSYVCFVYCRRVEWYHQTLPQLFVVFVNGKKKWMMKMMQVFCTMIQLYCWQSKYILMQLSARQYVLGTARYKSICSQYRWFQVSKFSVQVGIGQYVLGTSR